jgi:hypothetical protein
MSENERETFEGGVVRDKTDYRYDLMSPLVCEYLLNANNIQEWSINANFVRCFYTFCAGDLSLIHDVLLDMQHVLNVDKGELAHLYAQALHEGANKYGERNWEKGIPESNLINHALHHLIRFCAKDTSENHQSHLVWNVLTLIHFRLAKEAKGEQS